MNLFIIWSAISIKEVLLVVAPKMFFSTTELIILGSLLYDNCNNYSRLFI